MAIGTSQRAPRCSATIGNGNCAAADTEATRLVAMILAPLDDPAAYLRAIAALSKVCRREGFVSQVVSLESPGEVWKAFEASNQQLPSYVKAGDIMQRDFPLLHETDSLSDAIDTFCQLGVNELPVIDADDPVLGELWTIRGRDGKPGPSYTEGPWFYKRNNQYYMIYAAAGIIFSHQTAQSISSRHISC